ncbi:hypothetical protein [Streptomyces sp. NPDC101165]|uniref:hypothetical protein n=1 Tax=Streptomyces sp. NPDC101165 TaxID=3366119 RepID=UPI00382E3434
MTDLDRPGSDSQLFDDPYERGKLDWAYLRWILLAGFILTVSVGLVFAIAVGAGQSRR